jgi:hypothetical protein
MDCMSACCVHAARQAALRTGGLVVTNIWVLLLFFRFVAQVLLVVADTDSYQ